MKRSKALGLLAGVLGLAGIICAAGTQYPYFHTRWLGMGALRNTEQFSINTPSAGASAIFSPGTNNTNALGSSSLRFSNVYTTLMNVSGAMTVSGAGSLAGITNSGTRIATPTTYTMGTGTTCTPTSEFGLFTSTGGAITVTATPTIATTTATNGQIFEIMSSTASAITLKDNDSTTGTLLQFTSNTASRTLNTTGDVIAFRYYNGTWYEVYFSTH